MKVTLAVHGGQAAAIRLGMPPRVVEADVLPEAEADELARLVAAVREAEGPVTGERGRRVPDAMSYTVTVEDGGRSTVHTRSDTTMTEPFAALLAWLEEHAR